MDMQDNAKEGIGGYLQYGICTLCLCCILIGPIWSTGDLVFKDFAFLSVGVVTDFVLSIAARRTNLINDNRKGLLLLISVAGTIFITTDLELSSFGMESSLHDWFELALCYWAIWLPAFYVLKIKMLKKAPQSVVGYAYTNARVIACFLGATVLYLVTGYVLYILQSIAQSGVDINTRSSIEYFMLSIPFGASAFAWLLLSRIRS